MKIQFQWKYSYPITFVAGITVTIVLGLLPKFQTHSGFGHNHARIVTKLTASPGFGYNHARIVPQLTGSPKFRHYHTRIVTQIPFLHGFESKLPPARPAKIENGLVK